MHEKNAWFDIDDTDDSIITEFILSLNWNLSLTSSIPVIITTIFIFCTSFVFRFAMIWKIGS